MGVSGIRLRRFSYFQNLLFIHLTPFGLTFSFLNGSEFVNCVQSIKILSCVEVQQMSLDGDLGNGPIPNQASSGTDSGNAWRGHYDDQSAASFNR